MSYFIIIRGPAGVGKTTIADALAKLLDGFHISIDSILAEHGLDYVSGDPCIPEHKMLASNKIVIPSAQKRLASEQIVIFDGNFYHQSQIDDLIAALGPPFFVFTLKADLQTCLTRNKVRTIRLHEQAVKDVFDLVSKFDYGFVVDTNNKTIEKIVQEIMIHLTEKKDVVSERTMIDLKKLDEAIEVVAYDPSWPAHFEQEAQEIKKNFSADRLGALEHYGSTSVPGLSAKPIVDILVGLNEFKLSDEEIKKLETLGYEFIGLIHPTVDRFFLRKRGAQNFNLAVVVFDGQEWHNNLVTRDYLRTHSDEAAKYADVKNEALRHGLKTLFEYHAYKDEFVKGLRERAQQWKKKQ